MARPQKRFVCQSCGAVSSKWSGQCLDCSDWNCIVEDAGGVVTPFKAKHNLQGGGQWIDLVGLDSKAALPERLAVGVGELDRALGGGFVAGSATLIGGDPGVGKSTLLLQLLAQRAGVVTVVLISQKHCPSGNVIYLSLTLTGQLLRNETLFFFRSPLTTLTECKARCVVCA